MAGIERTRELGPQRPLVVIFDLDGTLSDSAPGILAALRHAFRVNDLPVLDPQVELSLLGPPFYDSLPPLIGAHKVPAVIKAYRAQYGAGGLFEASVYDGVPEVLAALRASGIRLAVATSKPEHYAVQIVERFGLAEYFETVGGDEFDGSLRTKALVIDKVLQRLGAPDPSTVLMVGDRAQDVVGAQVHGIACVGAAWGYGLPGELAEAGASPICARPRDLLAALGVAAA